MAEVDTKERLAIEAECARMVNQWMWCIDAAAHHEGSELFAPDGSFPHYGKPYFGPEGVREMFTIRDNSRNTAHLVTNLLIDVIDADNAAGRGISTIYIHGGPFDPATAAPLSPVTVMGFDVPFTRTEAGWRFGEWRLHDDFRAG